jgi:hypothetical protein
MNHREELTQRLCCERQEEHGVRSHEKLRNREQLFVEVPGFPEHDVALWATPQEECHVLVLRDRVVVVLSGEVVYFHLPAVVLRAVEASGRGNLREKRSGLTQVRAKPMPVGSGRAILCTDVTQYS